MTSPAAKIERCNPLTSVQDMGRLGHRADGVSVCGAADTISLRIGNRLVGNPDHAAAIECAMGGLMICFEQDSTLALTGAAVAHVRDRLLPMYRPVRVRAGDTVRLDRSQHGLRGYICVAGGFVTPLVLGSRSVHAATGIGGKPCTAGETLPIGTPSGSCGTVDRAALTELIGMLRRRTFRIMHGPQADTLTHTDWERLLDAALRVDPQSNRIGLRVHGPDLNIKAGHMLSEAVHYGAIQATPDGNIIVLGSDCAPTGGYPVVASVIQADLHALGQVGPGETVRFELMSVQQARALHMKREAQLRRAVQKQGGTPWPNA